jgi:hypothetical protein
MNIFEIVELEDPVDELDTEEKPEGEVSDDNTSSAAKKAFRGILHKYKKFAKKGSKKDVSSTWIAGLDYDHESKDCAMRLNTGQVYTVKSMDPNTYYNWVKSPSKGKFFHKYIKMNQRIV